MAREMKDSGIEWIGEIPIDWKLVPIKYVASYNDDTLGENINSGYEFDYIEIGSVEYGKGIIQVEHLKFEDAPSRARRIVRKDDIIVSTVRTYLRAIATVQDSDNTQIASTGFVVIRAKAINPEYLRYSILSESFIGMVEAYSTGISYPAINSSTVVGFKVPVPDSQKQKEIAFFLNNKCSKLNNVLEKTRASIEEYKKLKQAVITQAVTKGIRGDREMKDSGIEWNNQIPAEWNSINPKALFRQRKDKAFEGEKQLTASQQHGIMFQNDYMELTGVKVVTVEKDFEILKHVEAGDFVISMRSFQGGLEYSELSGSISSAYVMLVPNLELVYPRFYRWLLKSEVYIRALQSTSNMVRDGQAMRYSNFSQVRLYTVPIEEQKEIAQYLDEKCAVIDELIVKKEKYLSEIENYKKSLIYEYVTGKKEVPQNC